MGIKLENQWFEMANYEPQTTTNPWENKPVHNMFFQFVPGKGGLPAASACTSTFSSSATSAVVTSTEAVANPWRRRRQWQEQ